MMDLVIRDREASRSSRTRGVRPVVEGLEDRMLLYSVTGDHFVYGSRITWSIMPDGTNLGGSSSNLISTLNQQLGNGNWQPALQDAFAQWENVANINLVQVGDDGTPFGQGIYQQGSPTYGDIRIGGTAQASGVLGFTLLPPSANGGSDAGDIFLNTNETWHINSNFDLETVLFHEIGHALGMGHSTDINAAMYPYYGGVEQGPNSDDIAGIRSIWGPRQEDPFVQNTNNLSSANAANITGFMTQANNQIYLPGLNVASSAEGYWFKFTTPANASNNLTVQVQSSLLSELSPRVQIYNASLKGLAQASASANTYGAVLATSINNATPNTTYYVKVLGSNSGDTGTGAYAMTVNMGSGSIAISPPPTTIVLAQPDQGGGSDQMTVGALGYLKELIRDGENILQFGQVSLGNAIVIQQFLMLAQLPTPLVVMATDAFDQALIGLLQAIPTNDLQDSITITEFLTDSFSS